MAEDSPLEEQVLHRLTGGVAWITLNRPEVRNAMTPDQRNRLIALLEEASAALEVRAVVLTGTGKGFCTGADLRAGSSIVSRPEGAPERPVGEVSRGLRTGAQRLVASIMDCEKPVIAAVNGTAAGLGAHLAFACDLIIAAEGVRFIEVFARRALVPDGGGAWLLPRIVGPHKAKELLLLAEDLPAEEALRLGLVNRVVPAEELQAAAGEWAARLAAGPTRALALTKWLVNRGLESDRATSFAEEAMAQELNMGTHDAAEGVRSFVERREPEFKGW